MKIFYFDLETTGTRYWKNSIHQISFIIEIDGEVKETFNFHVKPYHKAEIDPAALAIAGVTVDDLKDYAEMKDVYEQIVSILGRYVNKFDKTDKFFLCGFRNAGFDDDFFRAWFVQNEDPFFGSWFWGNSLDVSVLASEHFRYVRNTMTDFKLRTVAAALMLYVDESKLHDALYDISLTREMYKTICVC